MENKKQEDKELQDIIDEISGVAKDLVDEYVSGEEKYVSEDEQAKLNEQLKILNTSFFIKRIGFPKEIQDFEQKPCISLGRPILLSQKLVFP